MINQRESRVQGLVESIRARGSTLEALAQRLRTPAILARFDKWDPVSWCRAVAGDALVKLRLFTEQNFNFVETVGLIAVARYLFELSVWLHLFKGDRRYGLVYLHQLLATQEHYFRATKAQLEREVVLLKEFDRKEREAHRRVVDDVNIPVSSATDGQALASAIRTISEEIDAEAARRFSIYASGARANGYGFQAHLVETQGLPRAVEALDAIAAERRTFDATVSKEIKALIPGRWHWQKMAEVVGKTAEYDYIYCFASKLLHATPASITTDEKNLEPEEMEVFLKYIAITIDDLIVLADEYSPQEHRAG
jgi:hypothetical protein